jgi:cell wall-associated NlpC family hydrolase
LPFGVSLPILGIDTSFVTVEFPWGEVGVATITELPTFPNMRDRIIHFAKTFLGVPYHWGGISSFGCDCSGFVQTVFKAAGIHLPRDSYQQREVPNGRQISLEDTKIGDLIFFAEDGKIDHVGITLGKREIIHCSGYVQIESLAEDSETFNNKLFNRFESCISINELMD